jgi:hypothetical protein
MSLNTSPHCSFIAGLPDGPSTLREVNNVDKCVVWGGVDLRVLPLPEGQTAHA